MLLLPLVFFGVTALHIVQKKKLTKQYSLKPTIFLGGLPKFYSFSGWLMAW